MPRAARKAPGGQVYHVLNRSVGRMHLVGKSRNGDAARRLSMKPTADYEDRDGFVAWAILP